MAIEFWGKGIDDKPNDTLGWFGQSVIPVFDESHIPTEFKEDFLGFETGGTQTIEPIKLHDVGGSGTSKLLAPWTANTIQLNDFQFELLWALNEGKRPGEEMPEYLKAFSNRDYRIGSTPEVAGATIPNNLKDKRTFKVKKIFIGSSAQYMKRSREKRVTDIFVNLAGFLLAGPLWGIVTASWVTYDVVTREFYEELDFFKYGVYYVVGTLEEPEQQQETGPSSPTTGFSSGVGAANTQQGSLEALLAFPKKPSLINITRNPDNFSEATLQTRDAGEGMNPGVVSVRVRFIFDNGVEKYADIISIEEK